MAEPGFVLSPAANADLDAIESYIATQSGAARARNVLERIFRSLIMLAHWPNVGRLHPEIEGTPRSFPVAPWIAFYEPSTELDGIYVLRILDGRRDLDTLLPKKRKSR